MQYLGELGADAQVRRNDQVTLGEVEAMAPEQLLISPGPGRPEMPGSRPTSSADSGRRRRYSASVSVIRRLGSSTAASSVEPTLRCTARRRPSCTMARACLRDQRALPGRALSLPRDRVRQRAGGTRSGGANTGGWNHHGRRHWRTPCTAQFHPESVLTGEGRKILRNSSTCDVSTAHREARSPRRPDGR